ncbi:hypothetical protein AWU65_14415 [Paenibacillus glucanolyticus]|uniref:Ribosomal RNA methyltransferase FtsJ domain-containing protein n=1 Tax=Paenibacillus glucanolyticus TaxID=59843 RepID=A0A163K6X4_9BACL|nr:TlyA family RNA methyltransferase [Paenibacillus glucanolyticus]KZS47032.1 hypothetical protein AWU65_14415 [Paenibacillus glucanolyticus]
MKTKKLHLWELLVDRGIFEDKKTATTWVMAGKVLVSDELAVSSAEKFPENVSIRIKGNEHGFVGKGGLKLKQAIEDFSIDVSGKTTLDTGASTGGFTDCLLQHNASKVYAIDVGYGQLAGKLRLDPRVVNMEKRNIGEIQKSDLLPLPDLATVDLSYLSLKKSIPIIKNLLAPDGELVCLVKPLFEVTETSIRRTGEIKNSNTYKDVLLDLVSFVHSLNLTCVGVTNSPITGNKGTREFFLHITSQNVHKREFDILKQVDLSIERALQLVNYRK